MKEKRRSIFETGIVVGILAIHLALALSLSFEDSEIWGITSSQRIFHTNFTWNSTWFKPAFSTLLGTLPLLTTDNWTVLMLGRALSWLFALASVVSLYKLLPRRRPFYLTISVLSPFALLNFTKVRSDVFSAAIALVALQILYSERSSRRLRTIAFLTCSSLAILMTPKSVDLFAILALCFLAKTDPRSSKIDDQLSKTLLVLAPIAGVFLTLLLFSKETFAHLFRYLNDLYSEPQFWGNQNWVYIFDFVRHSPVTVLTILIGVAFGVAYRQHLSGKERALLLGGVISLFTTLVFPQKLPFLIASRLPFWLLAASVGTEYALSQICRIDLRKFLAGMAAISVAVTAYYLSRTPYEHFNQQEQRTGYTQLEKLVDTMAPLVYWDAIGLFPLKNNVFHFPSPHDSKNVEIFEYIQELKPKLVIATSKVQLLGFSMEAFLIQNYVEISPHIWIRSCRLDQKEICRWSVSELLSKAKSCNLRVPLALFFTSGPNTSDHPSLLRIPFSFSNGADADILSENLPWSIELPACVGNLTLTEALPLESTTLPDPNSLFGFNGLL